MDIMAMDVYLNLWRWKRIHRFVSTKEYGPLRLQLLLSVIVTIVVTSRQFFGLCGPYLQQRPSLRFQAPRIPAALAPLFSLSSTTDNVSDNKVRLPRRNCVLCSLFSIRTSQHVGSSLPYFRIGTDRVTTQ